MPFAGIELDSAELQLRLGHLQFRHPGGDAALGGRRGEGHRVGLGLDLGRQGDRHLAGRGRGKMRRRVGGPGREGFRRGFGLAAFGRSSSRSGRRSATATAGPANLSGNETWPLPPTNACAGFAGAAIRRSAVPSWVCWTPPRQMDSLSCRFDSFFDPDAADGPSRRLGARDHAETQGDGGCEGTREGATISRGREAEVGVHRPFRGLVFDFLDGRREVADSLQYRLGGQASPIIGFSASTSSFSSGARGFAERFLQRHGGGRHLGSDFFVAREDDRGPAADRHGGEARRRHRSRRHRDSDQVLDRFVFVVRDRRTHCRRSCRG